MLALGIAWGQGTKPRKTDAQIKQEIIKESIASYRGSCPRRYNTDPAEGAAHAVPTVGQAAVRRSASNKTLTPKMVEDYRKRTSE